MHGHSRTPGAEAPDGASALRVRGLASPLHAAARLKQLGRRPRRGLSQSFLTDAAAARGIVAAARLAPEHQVLEVGPGLGVLTERLVARARRVVAVELDSELARALPAAVPAPNLEVIQADVLSFRPEEVFDEPYVVVANLPYHVTSPALRHLLAAGPPFASRLVVMVQREVAERMAAPVGALSALGVLVQAQARVILARRVPAGAFHPPPSVDSTVVVLEPLDERVVPREELAAFETFLHAGFAQPRKVLGNSLAQGLRRQKGEVEAALRDLGIDPARRPQQLSLEEWARLFRGLPW